MSIYLVNVEWQRDGATFADNRYSRRHTWRFDGGAVVAASASPSIVRPPLADPSAVDPEEAFVAAVSSCHMLCFLSIAAKRGFVVEGYVDEAEGILSSNAEGRQAMTKVTLRPRVRYSGTPPSQEEEMTLHEAAHEICFIANSVRTEIIVEPVRTEIIVEAADREPID